MASLAVIGTVGTFLAPKGAPQQFLMGATPSSPAPKGQVMQPPGDPTTRNTLHLREALGAMLPGATEVEVSQFRQENADLMRATVVFRDSAGLPGTFDLTIAGPLFNSASGPKTRLADLCNPRPVDPDGNIIPQWVRPDGKPLRCDKILQFDGTTVVMREDAMVAAPAGNPIVVEKPDILQAIHIRADGTTVEIMNWLGVSSTLAERFGFKNPDGIHPPNVVRSEFPLTEQQMIKIITDPAFNVK